MCEAIDNWIQQQNNVFKNVMGASFNTELAEERNLMLKWDIGMLKKWKEKQEKEEEKIKKTGKINQKQERENRS